jgi:hypothetical protein
MNHSIGIYGGDKPEVWYTDNMTDKGFLEQSFPSLKDQVYPVSPYVALPRFELPPDNHFRIILKSTGPQIDDALNTIIQRLDPDDNNQTVEVGWSTKWNVDQNRGAAEPRGSTAIVAISVEDHCYILEVRQLSVLLILSRTLS